MKAQQTSQRVPHGGYFKTEVLQEDAELTHVGPGTPCGEYMRRFWQPVALASELSDLPLAVRILGEDLVLFRDRSGRLGLLHRHCSHRLASLEYGVIEERGIRCCYHGWLYDVDGTILEAPAEPPTSKVKESLRQGAYLVLEYKGLIFAYMGPPDEKPPFPIYDTFDIPGDELVPYSLHIPCNWMQVCENSSDTVHAAFLHTRMTGAQFNESWGIIPVLDFHERPFGYFITNARRVGANIMARTHDILLPNMTQVGPIATSAGEALRFFARVSLTRWVVPLDNTNTRILAWRHFNEKRGDPATAGYKDPHSLQQSEIGQIKDRPYEERQRRPGDYEVMVGQGPIAVHKKEHLASTDRGVALFRKRIRQGIRAVRNGERLPHPAELISPPIPTYSGETVLRVPRAAQGDDNELLLATSRRVAAIYVEADNLKGMERDAQIERRLKETF